MNKRDRLAFCSPIIFAAWLLLPQWGFAQQPFVPHWQSLPWDSGGYDPTSVVWSMVQSDLDLDHDGKKEFFAITSWSGAYFNTAYLYEAADNDSFAIVWSYSFYPYSNDFSAITVGDLNANGRQEILCLVDPYDSTYHGFYVFEWDGTDNGLPLIPTATWNLGLPKAFQEGTAIVADDFDNDGTQEVAVSFVEDWYSPKSKIMIFSSTSSAFSDSTWQIEFVDSTTFPYVGYALSSTDLDRDGTRELVAVGWDTLRVAIYKHTGVPDSYQRIADIKNISPYIDLSNMGITEANYDNDATNELYLLTANGSLYVATNSGDVNQMTAANFHLLYQHDYFKGMVGLTKADMNKNGVPELYLAGGYNEAVYRFSYIGGPVTDPSSYVHTTVFQDDTTDSQNPDSSDQGYLRPTKVAAGDFDQDGIPDMIISSASFAADKSVLMMIEQNSPGSVYVRKGWNIVSLPLLTDDRLKSVVFPTASTDAYTFTETGYARKDTLVNGVGYWMKFTGSETLSVNGAVHPIDAVDVMPGWNMVGSVSNPIPVSSVTSTPGGIISSPYYEFNAGYTKSDSIQPGKGYWVKAEGQGKIILSSPMFRLKSNSERVNRKHEYPLRRKSFTRGKQSE